MTLEVNSNLVCTRCDSTYRHLISLGIEFKVNLVEIDDVARQRAKDLKYLEAPVVIASDDNHWSGYRPDLLDALAAELTKKGVTLTPLKGDEAKQAFDALKKSLKERHALALAAAAEADAETQQELAPEEVAA